MSEARSRTRGTGPDTTIMSRTPDESLRIDICTETKRVVTRRGDFTAVAVARGHELTRPTLSTELTTPRRLDYVRRSERSLVLSRSRPESAGGDAVSLQCHARRAARDDEAAPVARPPVRCHRHDPEGLTLHLARRASARPRDSP